ncbi:hypothetical protein niasHT_018701 [Heterodera trifolii]|uniref:BTB domain-containing protein n=1 Tax=Heterodera trifolii TaxID=157864 RepID=A0ABD2LCS5_9BILA
MKRIGDESVDGCGQRPRKSKKVPTKTDSSDDESDEGNSAAAESPANKWIKLMLSTGEYADVHFLVGDGDAKVLLPAHRLILKNASDVFKAMFRFDSKNERAENASANCPVVEVPDVEAAAFKVMLSFIYADDLSKLNGDNAMAVLYAADKYNIPGLVDRSLQIPFSELRNVFFAYAQARLFDFEDYCNDCLDYIDRNADALLKSDGFLQIDQKLLCEILERQLQIREEISIWQACRENDIECSAENRRQMLGPALFKIRFPLFSQEDFSQKIVPSKVLSEDEVIAINHFHSFPNCHGISDGIFPMQFPTNERFMNTGTLLLDIEKVSEFGQEPEESSRCSKKMYINGLSWKIMAQIGTRIESDERRIYIYLLCDAPNEENWSCKCSATIRIISQKCDVADIRKEYAADFEKNQYDSWGCRDFRWRYLDLVEFAKLVDPKNGLYDKCEDKVTFAIDVTVKEAQTGK